MRSGETNNKVAQISLIVFWRIVMCNASFVLMQFSMMQIQPFKLTFALTV